MKKFIIDCVEFVERKFLSKVHRKEEKNWTKRGQGRRKNKEANFSYLACLPTGYACHCGPMVREFHVPSVAIASPTRIAADRMSDVS